jgi:hypothetical protein
MIHSDDSAQFAEVGLAAAICYAKIAPEVPPALHMPSHFFTRLGMLGPDLVEDLSAALATRMPYIGRG